MRDLGSTGARRSVHVPCSSREFDPWKEASWRMRRMLSSRSCWTSRSVRTSRKAWSPRSPRSSRISWICPKDLSRDPRYSMHTMPTWKSRTTWSSWRERITWSSRKPWTRWRPWIPWPTWNPWKTWSTWKPWSSWRGWTSWKLSSIRASSSWTTWSPWTAWKTWRGWTRWIKGIPRSPWTTWRSRIPWTSWRAWTCWRARKPWRPRIRRSSRRARNLPQILLPRRRHLLRGRHSPLNGVDFDCFFIKRQSNFCQFNSIEKFLQIKTQSINLILLLKMLLIENAENAHYLEEKSK